MHTKLKNPSGHNENFPGSRVTSDAVEFGKAMQQFMTDHNLKWYELDYRDVLRVARTLGYRKETA